MCIISRITFMLSLLLLTVQPVGAAKVSLLRHDDGSQEEKRSMAGAGHAVRFQCPDGEKWYVTALSVHGSRYGTAQVPNEDFQVVIANDDLTQRQEIKKPYSLFKRGKEEWVRFDIDPVEVQGAFHAAVFFNPTQTKGVYVGIDSDSSPTNSAIVSASDPGKKRSELEGDWMIRAYLTKDVEGEALTLMDDKARAAELKVEEDSSDAAILGDARSVTLKQDSGPTEDHMNIQGALYTVAFATPRDVEGYVWQVQIYASQFGAQHDSEAVNGDIYILDENRKIITRTSFPYSFATQQKEWISILTLPTKVQGKFYVSIDSHGTRFKGLYMGYEDGNKDKVASTDGREGDHVNTGDWSDKFANMQWLIRAKIADRPVVY